MDMPILETTRLLVRPFRMDDLDEVHRLLDVDLREADLWAEKMDTRVDRREWLEWSVLNYAQLARLHQPPYGDRAVVLAASGQLIAPPSRRLQAARRAATQLGSNRVACTTADRRCTGPRPRPWYNRKVSRFGCRFDRAVRSRA
jgi:hypothetical protein